MSLDSTSLRAVLSHPTPAQHSATKQLVWELQRLSLFITLLRNSVPLLSESRATVSLCLADLSVRVIVAHKLTEFHAMPSVSVMFNVIGKGDDSLAIARALDGTPATETDALADISSLNPLWNLSLGFRAGTPASNVETGPPAMKRKR